MEIFVFVGIASFALLGALFANAMVWYEKTPRDKFKAWQWAYYAAFILLDVLWNWIFASILFLSVPREFTLSERLRNILRHSNKKWRVDIAFFMCKRFIEPHDQGHCGLGYIWAERGRNNG